MDEMPLTQRNPAPGDGCPVIIENPESFPFQPGERERDWRPATEEEYEAYVQHWLHDNA